MYKLHRLILLLPFVFGWTTALTAATDCEKPDWENHGWAPVTHYFAVGAVKLPGKYATVTEPYLTILYAQYTLDGRELPNQPPFACGLTADAMGKTYIVRMGGVYSAALSTQPQPPVDGRSPVRTPIKYTTYGNGLIEDDVVYFPAKTQGNKGTPGGRFTIVGAVKKPGQYSFGGSLTLFGAMALAGGLTQEGGKEGYRLHGDEIIPLHAETFAVSFMFPEIVDGDVIVITQCRTAAPIAPFDKRPECSRKERE